MAVDQVVLSINTALTLSIGLISLIIVYGSSKNIEDELVGEFAHRLTLVIGVLLLFVFYWGLYNYAWRGITVARYPLYLALIFIFLYLMWSVMSFQKLARKYGLSKEKKMEKLKNEELGDQA
ncbi:MAG: hypothetical protein ABEJ75_01685 [Candidatus Nanohaloarchaea archaeon]